MEARFWLLTLTPLLALLSYATILYVVVQRGLRPPLHRIFALYILVMATWSLGSAMMRLDPEHIVLWNQVTNGSVIVMSLAFFAFVQAFLGERWGMFLVIGLVIALGLEVASGLGLIVTNLTLMEGGLLHFDAGPLFYAMAIFGVFFLGSCIWFLGRAHRRTSDPVLRNRIRYPLIGGAIVLLGGATNLSSNLSQYPVDHAANLANALLLTYAILRYRLLDVKVVVRRGLRYSIPTVMIGAAYFLLVFLGVRLFRLATGYQVFLLALIMAALTAVAFQPLRDWVQSWVDRFFFRFRYDSGLMLQRLSRTAASVLDLGRLTGMILDEVTETMQIGKAAFFLKHEDSGEFRMAAQRGLEQSAAVRLRKDHPLVRWSSVREGVLTRQQMDYEPRFKALWSQERQDLDTIGAKLFVPLRVREELTGILVLGPKLSGAPYAPDEQLTLSTLANQTAVAVENARLYQQTIEEKERTETILEQAFSGIMVVDPSTRILTLNPEVEAITGYATEELLGRRLVDVFDQQLLEEDSILAEVMEAGVRLAPAEATLVGRHGARDILLGVTPIREGYLLSFSDITRLKDVERLKSNIVANVSHELRAPLASIKAYTEVLLDNLEGEDLVLRQEFLSIIDQESDWLAELINDLLDLSRLESGQYSADMDLLSMGEVIEGVVALLDVQIRKKDVSVEIHVPADLPLILADKELMRILVKNLLSNAVKFSPEGEQVAVQVYKVEDALVLRVIDRGIGIPPGDMPHLFTKFYRSGLARESGIRGTGLGLALAREAVEIHDGEIKVESELGVGTQFTVRLPVKHGAGAESILAREVRHGRQSEDIDCRR
jgi:PAS domain S-box-containing protein